jgi:hypothetical protein
MFRRSPEPRVDAFEHVVTEGLGFGQEDFDSQHPRGVPGKVLDHRDRAQCPAPHEIRARRQNSSFMA